MNKLSELDPIGRAITAEELRDNCGFQTKEEAAENPYKEPSSIVWSRYTWRQRVECLERRYVAMHNLGRSERQIQDSVNAQLEIMRKQGVKVDE